MGQLYDQFGRRFHYLRLSVTEACNFRCVYCLPNGYKKCSQSPVPLRADEIRNLVAAFSELGLQKVRLTGGEPTTRGDLLNVIHTVAGVERVKKVALSTNGYSLKRRAREFREAGVTALNVSVDSLDSKKFFEITGQDRLGEVLDGLSTALSLGFESVKINTVLLKGVNDSDLMQFLDYVKDRPIALRFIELMRTGDNGAFFDQRHLNSTPLRQRLESMGWKEGPRKIDDGPAIEFVHPSFYGRIGIIAPYSKEFCKTCNRLRVSSTGDMRLCLFGGDHHSLRPLLQLPSQKNELIETVTNLIGEKPYSHLLNAQETGKTRHLAEIGG